MDSVTQWADVILPFVIGALGGIGTLWVAMNQGRKNRYDAVDQANEALMKFITPLQNHIDSQEGRLKVQEEEMRKLRDRVRVLESKLSAKEELINKLVAGVNLLTHQIVASGQVPIWHLEPREAD